MKNLLLTMLFCSAATTTHLFANETTAEKKETKKEATEFTSKEIELLSKSYGNMIGQNLNAIGLELDNNHILAGIQDAFNGIEPALEDSKTIEMITALQEKKFKKECETNLKAAEAFLASNKDNKSIIQLEEGKLQYKQLAKGEGKECAESDTPIIAYEGRYLDGTVFGQSERDEPITLNETIEGFKKAILGMKVGEKREVYIHPNLGYGANSALAPNALLTFEITLKGFQEQQKENAELGDLPGPDTFAAETKIHDTVK